MSLFSRISSVYQFPELFIIFPFVGHEKLGPQILMISLRLDPLRGQEPSPPAVESTRRGRWRAERRRSYLECLIHDHAARRSRRPSPPYDRAGRLPSAARTKESARPGPRSCRVPGFPVGGKWRLARATASPREPRSVGTATGRRYVGCAGEAHKRSTGLLCPSGGHEGP
ncbi:hypothetical protein NDU88_000302 [Pleurodeles waltl]|uniref:Uncharacterized protein n=1 Tax=Pleurodeles waltl TaxID=8319 RepID=A0AAV7S6F5_PLEWA|nr:hypothetical protein NDU88_000302 [Pleurodeles waltl]